MSKWKPNEPYVFRIFTISQLCFEISPLFRKIVIFGESPFLQKLTDFLHFGSEWTFFYKFFRKMNIFRYITGWSFRKSVYISENIWDIRKKLKYTLLFRLSPIYLKYFRIFRIEFPSLLFNLQFSSVWKNEFSILSDFEKLAHFCVKKIWKVRAHLSIHFSYLSQSINESSIIRHQDVSRVWSAVVSSSDEGIETALSYYIDNWQRISE